MKYLLAFLLITSSTSFSSMRTSRRSTLGRCVAYAPLVQGIGGLMVGIMGLGSVSYSLATSGSSHYVLVRDTIASTVGVIGSIRLLLHYAKNRRVSSGDGFNIV